MHTYFGIFDDGLHCLNVCSAGKGFEAGMGMPFAQVVEASVIAASFLKKLFQLSSVIVRIANETGLITSGPLHRHFDDAETFIPQMLSHQESADFASAARTALQINWAVDLINAELKSFYEDKTDYVIRQAVGVDNGKLLVAKTGIRGSNDLVWVGTAANRAAKLCALREGSYTSFLTSPVYKVLHKSAKFGKDDKNMWTKLHWSDYDIDIYCAY
jgi:class 3 adenylate cyclase